jgi:arylsulfatase A-like enzyme
VPQSTAAKENSSSPNIVLIFIDDLGYADVRPFGKPKYATPHLDRLAAEGRVFTDFSVSSAVCSASRAALLTGCYHVRVGISGALGPNAKVGLSPDEKTIAEICRSRGYATACIGKWHLGHEQLFLPLQQGFDQYYGLPYSNDMWPYHPAHAKLPAAAAERKAGYPNLPLIEGDQVIDPEITAEDQTRLTSDYTARAVQFIRDHREQPFFLYLAHSMVHVPLFVSEERAGKSGQGLFGDVMEEVDWSVGQILDALVETGADDNTLVIFTSDNGPWLSYGAHGGSALPLREGKGTSFEGGIRVPTIMRWPDRIPPGSRCDEFAATIDVLPTIARLIGADLPTLPIDGLDISSLMFAEPPPESPHECYYVYYGEGALQAVRDRRWKLIFPHRYSSLVEIVDVPAGSPMPYAQREIELSLFDLKSDPGESRNVLSEHPEVVARLEAHAIEARTKFGDRLKGVKGNAIRGPAPVIK